MVDGKDANIAPELRTVGLDYFSWKPRPEDSLDILMLDCAGQRKYLLTHQFFLTEGMSCMDFFVLLIVVHGFLARNYILLLHHVV